MRSWVNSLLKKEETVPGSQDDYKAAHDSHFVDKPWQETSCEKFVLFDGSR